MIPACSRPDPDVIRWLIDHGSRPQDQLQQLMATAVGWNERQLAWGERQIEVLRVLAEFIPEGDTELLSETLQTACWFGNVGPVAWLIEQGADTHHESWNAIEGAKVDCLRSAQMRGERLGDYLTYEFLRPRHERDEPLGAWRHLYD